MMQDLTDEEAIAHADEQVERVAKALAVVSSMNPGTTIEALSQALYMVNGKDWIGSTEMARARVRAKELCGPPPRQP